jgi:hypothetical protein
MQVIIHFWAVIVVVVFTVVPVTQNHAVVINMFIENLMWHVLDFL